MIRIARKGDIDHLVELYNKVKLDRNKLGNRDYDAEIQKRGFLLGLDKKETLLEQIENAYGFLIEEGYGKVLGYLIADHREEQKFYDDEYKTWFDPALKNYYYHNPKGMTIALVAVNPEVSGKGVATELLETLEERLKKESFEYLFSIITLAPLTNCPSVVWHTKNGFKRLAMGRPRRLFELDNYSGVLLYKKLL